jgi:hypothetical protein
LSVLELVIILAFTDAWAVERLFFCWELILVIATSSSTLRFYPSYFGVADLRPEPEPSLLFLALDLALFLLEIGAKVES